MWPVVDACRLAATTAAAAAAAGTANHEPRLPPCSARAPSREGASLRAEAEAPFRSVRLFLFGAGLVGAGLATLFGLPQLIGALGGAPGATKSTAEALQVCGRSQRGAGCSVSLRGVAVGRTEAAPPNVPCLLPTWQDFAINIGCVTAFGFLVRRDLQVGGRGPGAWLRACWLLWRKQRGCGGCCAARCPTASGCPPPPAR